MTGTASELSDYDENEPRDLNSFDLFSLWLFKKAAASRLTGADLLKGLPLFKTINPPALHYDAECSMSELYMCDSPSISK
jgi:hypothetical protein